MSKIEVTVYPRRENFIVRCRGYVVFWGFLVGAVGLSRAWFGGAVVIDVAALFLALLGFIAHAKIVVGHFVVLSRDEVIAWVNAGAPNDVVAWKAARDG